MWGETTITISSLLIASSHRMSVNDILMELFIMCYGCKTAAARRIIGVYVTAHSLSLSSILPDSQAMSHNTQNMSPSLSHPHSLLPTLSPLPTLLPGVVPYLPYSRHCKMRKRGCITAKLIASMMGKAGMHQLITLDLRHKEIQGFFDFTVDNLRGSPFLIQYIREQVCKNSHQV